MSLTRVRLCKFRNAREAHDESVVRSGLGIIEGLSQREVESDQQNHFGQILSEVRLFFFNFFNVLYKRHI